MNTHSNRTQTTMRRASKAILLTSMFLLPGCGSTIGVSSSPSGARVIMNERDTGMTTPASIRVGSMPTGRSYITVAQEGFTPTPRQQEVEVRVSIGNIIWSWFPPILIKNLRGDRWRGVTYPQSRHLEDFVLQPALASPSAAIPIPATPPHASPGTHTHRTQLKGEPAASTRRETGHTPVDPYAVANRRLLRKLLSERKISEQEFHDLMAEVAEE